MYLHLCGFIFVRKGRFFWFHNCKITLWEPCMMWTSILLGILVSREVRFSNHDYKIIFRYQTRGRVPCYMQSPFSAQNSSCCQKICFALRVHQLFCREVNTEWVKSEQNSAMWNCQKLTKLKGVQQGSGCPHWELWLKNKQEADASTSSYCYFRTGKSLSVHNPLLMILHHKDFIWRFLFFYWNFPF